MNKPTGSIPRDALDQALKVIEGWKELKDKLMVPNFTMTDFQNAISETQQKIEAAEKKRQEEIEAEKIRRAGQLLLGPAGRRRGSRCSRSPPPGSVRGGSRAGSP